jgi:hypothetical protein
VPQAPADLAGAIADFRARLPACTLADTLQFAREQATYTPRPLRVGDVFAAAGECETAAVALALCKLLHLTRAETEDVVLRKAQPAYDTVPPDDREMFRAFALTGWEGCEFPDGLPLAWR